VATRLHHIISQNIVIVTEDHDMRNCNFASTVWFLNCYLAYGTDRVLRNTTELYMDEERSS